MLVSAWLMDLVVVKNISFSMDAICCGKKNVGFSMDGLSRDQKYWFQHG
jgi:hypothetical protein